MPSSPAISIVVPLYNEEGNVAELQQEIDRALAGQDYELVLVDDGSSDQTVSRVQKSDRVELQDLFEVGMHKSALVAMFLATLELTRQHGLHAVQETADGPLYLQPGPEFAAALDVSHIGNLGSDEMEKSKIPVVPR